MIQYTSPATTYPIPIVHKIIIKKANKLKLFSEEPINMLKVVELTLAIQYK